METRGKSFEVLTLFGVPNLVVPKAGGRCQPTVVQQFLSIGVFASNPRTAAR